MIDGVKIKLGEIEYVVPPLNLKSMRRLLPKLNTLKTSGLPGDEDLTTIVDVVHSALVRNYPNMTVEDVENGLDMVNMQGIVSQVLGQSGVKSGNVPTETATEVISTGDLSIGTSSLPPDGATTT